MKAAATGFCVYAKSNGRSLGEIWIFEGMYMCVVSYTEHKIYHFNHFFKQFKFYQPPSSCCLLYDYHPPPELSCLPKLKFTGC